MEGIGSEVSHKIRAAIKAKLIELGAYIDDELPDYIMVMVANKRSRHQMDEDLQLFLGSNTKTFTSWLYTVLQKLQEVTVANFDGKKESQRNKSEKRKHSNLEDTARKDSKSPDEQSKISKKHMKKGKDGKKLKKSKYKSKGKEKDKNLEKKQTGSESIGNDREMISQRGDEEMESPLVQSVSGDYKNKDKDTGNHEPKLNDSSRTKDSEKVMNASSEHDVSSTKSSSTSQDADEHTKPTPENEPEDASMEGNNCSRKTGEGEDDFNIEPLRPNETVDQTLHDNLDDKVKSSKSESQGKSTGMTIKAPTRELLKEHDKIISESEGNISKSRKKSDEESEDSACPDETRKPSSSRAKKKLQVSSRMKSCSPEGEASPNDADSKEEAERFLLQRVKRITHRRDHGVEEEDDSSCSFNRDGSKSNAWERSYSPKPKNENENSRNGLPSRSEQKNNIISISKSLEMEKNLGVKNEDQKKSTSKATSSPKKKPVPSRIFTIPEPEAPEIPSIVKVKPREYVPKDKQANKVLILKAVADAEKSIASVHSRNESEIDTKKSEGLFTKNLREKRYEKLAVTLSNVQPGAVNRVKSKRVVSVDSENANAADRKTESLKDSELSQGFRSIQELTLKNISNKSEDQFISSKTSAMEKNDKYIHCWLEGVEKAVKDDEIVNPSEIDDFRVSFSDEGKDEDDRSSLTDQDHRKKKPKNDDESSKNKKSGDKNTTSTEVTEDEGPQIVVTLDGLTSKAIKDIILRNRDAPNGPLLSSACKKTEVSNDADEGEMETGPGFRYKEADSSKEDSASKKSDSESLNKVNRFEKISERFGRINKTSENHEYKEKYYEFERERYEKKYLKYQGTDKEKHYEKLKDKYASAGESKNKKLIARLSEKFGKVDREFEDKKRKYSDDDLRYSYYSRRVDRTTERDAKYRKRDRNPLRSDTDDLQIVHAKERCMLRPNCDKGLKKCECKYPSQLRGCLRRSMLETETDIIVSVFFD